MIAPENFRTAFCRYVGCADSAFERELFSRGLYRHAIPFAMVLRLVAPRFFREDDDLIRNLASDGSMDEVREDIERFQYGNRIRRHWLRTGLRLHLSPKRVSGLAVRCLGLGPCEVG